jgi:hypothetical protein
MNLFLELRRHGKLSEKRNPVYEKNKFGKVFTYVMVIFSVGCLIFFGVMFAIMLKDTSREPYHFVNAGLFFLFAYDFLMRFPFQKLPTQEVKPYLLLPVKRRRLLDFLLIRSGLNSYNFLWLALFVPFALMSVWRFYGLTGVLTYCVGIWLLALLNNYWFLLCKTLIGERIVWVALPIIIYGLLFAAMFVPNYSLLDLSIDLGEGFIQGRLWAFAAVLALIALLWLVDRALMQHLVYNEVNKVEDTKVKHLTQYTFLERFGEMGEYLRLELKLLLRNRIPKNSLRSVTIVVVMFSLMLSFSEVYGSNMRQFILIYNFSIFGLMFLGTLMSYEGNYIDGLMSRRESIYTLLRAKYLLYASGLLIPFVLMIPAIVMGKFSLLSCVAWMLFTGGCVYFGMFQLAVYNGRTVHLNAKVTSRGSVGTGWQNFIGLIAIGLPLVINFGLRAFLDEAATSWVLLALGLLFILTSNRWLKNVYHRFMARRYANMEGFRDSRQG